MNSLQFLLPLLRCPNCHSRNLVSVANEAGLSCGSCGLTYPISFKRPVLLKQDNDVFNVDDYRNSPLFTPNFRKDFSYFIPAPSVNLSSERVLKNLRDLLSALPSAVVLVVGGGRQRQWLDDRLGASDLIKIIYTDIDVNADVDLFCDGHDLPFTDNTFDAVVTTAVLEHVLYPEKVVSEIFRVLKPGGKLYSELPFMQQVHEGAYDFTRYTLSGHRRLLNGFAEIESGMVAGPGTAMVWTIENFVLAFFRRPLFRTGAKAMVRLLFFWFKYFDLVLKNRPEAMDGASCTYFFGSKIEGRINDVEIIKNYTGAKHLKHT